MTTSNPMKFKYSDYVDQIEGCPPNHYQPLEIIVYRWIHENTDHPNNFLPTALISPQLVNDPIDLQMKCKRYGLSFFNASRKARKQYQRIIADHPKLVEQIGQHIAEGKLEMSDGISSKANPRTGHLTFHESSEADLKSKFQVIGRANEDE